MNDDKNDISLDDIELTGEDNVDETELEEVETNSKTALKKLKEKLKLCEKEKLQHLEDLQRTKADFLNSKRRLEEQSNRDIERANNAHIEKLLPLADSFQMATHDTEAWNTVDETWRKGIESIHTQLQSLLSDYEVEVINPVGEPFDPVEHEAMTTTDAEKGIAPETVVQVLQNGYKRNGELIRPAKVILSN